MCLVTFRDFTAHVLFCTAKGEREKDMGVAGEGGGGWFLFRKGIVLFGYTQNTVDGSPWNGCYGIGTGARDGAAPQTEHQNTSITVMQSAHIHQQIHTFIHSVYVFKHRDYAIAI